MLLCRRQTERDKCWHLFLSPVFNNCSLGRNLDSSGSPSPRFRRAPKLWFSFRRVSRSVANILRKSSAPAKLFTSTVFRIFALKRGGIINLVLNIESSLCSEISCLLLESPAVWHVKYAYQMHMTIPVTIQYSLTQTLLRENTSLLKRLSGHQDFSRVTEQISKRTMEPIVCQGQALAVSSSTRWSTQRPTQQSHCGSVVLAVAELQ